jgi:hypothetical protein
MAKWVHSDVLDGGLNAIKNSATKEILIKAYTAGDSYAAVQANKLAEATVSSADFTLSSSGNNRVLTTATKSPVASADSGAAPDNHIAFTDGVSKVLWVTDETTDQQVYTGNTENLPALTYNANQPI